MKNRPRVLLVFVLSLPGLLQASDQIPGKAQQGPIAVVGATIHPVTGPVMEGGTILFDGGKNRRARRLRLSPRGNRED